MLKSIPPLLTPDALHALASMGHGDELVIADANFPAARIAAAGGARLVQLPGADAPQVLRAVLQLLPLDDFGPEAAWTMQMAGDTEFAPPPVVQFEQVLSDAGEQPAQPLERFAFYERAQHAFAVFRSGEQRSYGNIILRKGVVN